MKKIIIILALGISQILSASTLSENSIKVDVSGEGEPLIFIPAVGCSGDMWKSTVEYFSSSYTCYVISIQGFGGLPAAQNQTIDLIKQDIVSFVKRNELKKSTLIGHSFGGSISIELAASNPEMFSKLVIIDSYSFPLDVFVPGITQDQAQQQSDILYNSLLASDEEAFKAGQKAQLSAAVTSVDDQAKILEWQINSDRTLFATAMSRMLSTDQRPALKNISIPTLVIGTWEAYVPYGFTKESTKNAFEKQYENLVNCKIVMAEKGKHFIMYDQTEWFYEQLDLFL